MISEGMTPQLVVVREPRAELDLSGISLAPAASVPLAAGFKCTGPVETLTLAGRKGQHLQ